MQTQDFPHLPPRPAGKRLGIKRPRKRPPVQSINDLTPADFRRLDWFSRIGMPRAAIRDIYRLSKGQLKRALGRIRCSKAF